MSEIAALQREVEILIKRVNRLEADAQIKKLLDAPVDPHTKAMLDVLKRLPQMAPYTE